MALEGALENQLFGHCDGVGRRQCGYKGIAEVLRDGGRKFERLRKREPWVAVRQWSTDWDLVGIFFLWAQC